MRRKKGFTLMELIIVIAIFGILLTVMTPAWAHYLQRSRTRTQNHKSRVIFNAAQTVVTDLQFSERKYFANISEANAVNHIYTPTDGSDWYYYWNGKEGHICDENGNAIDTSTFNATRADTIKEWDEKIGKAIQKILTDDVVYKFWVSNYHIVAVSSGNGVTDRFIGGYPTTIFSLDAANENTDSLKNTNARDVDLKWFDLDMDNNP
ncbi:MAG: prepilin-type N-terminal cleavage/methylation domain-containing protein [Ruminococcus sp.]|nr:prepilin-type N-terminal cleavage/methylation domain-containing protein [Ruminococcus sp.]